jgi:hypothetical protein
MIICRCTAITDHDIHTAVDRMRAAEAQAIISNSVGKAKRDSDDDRKQQIFSVENAFGFGFGFGSGSGSGRLRVGRTGADGC